MTLPRGNHPVDSRVWTKLLVNMLTVCQWESVVEQADVQSYLHLHDQTVVYEFSFWVRAILCNVIEPSISVFLKAVAEGGLSVMGHGLDWSVLCSLVVVKPIGENGRTLFHDNRSFLLPVGPGHYTDIVVFEAVNGFLSEGLEVLRVRSSARSKHNVHADVVIIPVRDDSHTS